MIKEIFIKNRNGLKMSVRVNVDKTRNKLVFLEHGLSSRQEYPHMLVLEEFFVENGYNVVHFDATNSLNASESSSEGITITGHYNDLEDTIAWAKTQNFYAEPFALAGQSLGAISVVKFAGKYPHKVDLLIPCAFPYLNGNIKLENDDIAKEIIKNGVYNKVSKSTGKIFVMKRPWVESLKSFDLTDSIKKITANTFVIVGNKDSTTHIENSKKLYQMLNSQKHFYLLDNVPHDLANTPETKTTFENALSEIFENLKNRTL